MLTIAFSAPLTPYSGTLSIHMVAAKLYYIAEGNLFTASLTWSPNPTMHIVAQDATPIRGTTPRKRPLTPDSWRIYRRVVSIDALTGRVGSAFIDCISTLNTCSLVSFLQKCQE